VDRSLIHVGSFRKAYQVRNDFYFFVVPELLMWFRKYLHPYKQCRLWAVKVSVVVESEPLHHSAIPFGTKSCPLLAKTPVWAITHCLEWMTSVRKEYRLYPCTLEELGEATNDAFLIEGVLNLKNPPPEVNEWNKHIPCGPEMNYWKGSDPMAKEQKIVTIILFIPLVGYFFSPFFMVKTPHLDAFAKASGDFSHFSPYAKVFNPRKSACLRIQRKTGLPSSGGFFEEFCQVY